MGLRPAQLTELALIGGGLLVAYVLARKAFTGIQDAAAVVTEPVAEGYVWATSGPGVQSLARIRLPNGQLLEPGAVKIDGGTMTFRWNGVAYRLTARNLEGNYDTVLVGT